MKSALIALLAFCLCWGVGCSKNISEFESFEETKTRAEKGDDIAQVNLGYMYANGEGVSQDLHEAAKWYRKAAEQGDVDAQYNLGNMFRTGEGVLKDVVTAYTWYNIAVANGNLTAEEYKPIIEKKMTPEQIAKAEELLIEMIKKNPKLLKKKQN